MADALHTAGLVVDAKEARLDQGGLIAVQGPAVLDIRTGVLVGPGTTALITGTSATAPWAVNVAAHHWVTSRGAANGPYLGTKEASTPVALSAPPASNSRIDVIYVKQQDMTAGIPTPDGAAGELYGVLTGTAAASPVKPSLSTIVGAEELGTVTILSTATAGTSGAGVTIANTARQTVARGADIPVRTKAERDVLTSIAYIGMAVKRLDDGGRVERWTGSTWAAESDVPVLASITARNTYFSGNLRAGASALVAGDLHVYDGATWRFTTGVNGVGTTDAAGFLAVAHNAGQVPRAVLPGVRDAGDTVNQRLKWLTQSADTSVAVIRAVRTDTSAYWTGVSLAYDLVLIF